MCNTQSQLSSYNPDEEWIELEGDEGKCSNCYHEEDFPHITMVLHKIYNYTLCLYCNR
jgi:hypothetical protein